MMYYLALELRMAIRALHISEGDPIFVWAGELLDSEFNWDES